MFKNAPHNTKIFYIAFIFAVFTGLSGFVGEVYYQYNPLEKGALYCIGVALLYWLINTAMTIKVQRN